MIYPLSDSQTCFLSSRIDLEKNEKIVKWVFDFTPRWQLSCENKALKCASDNLIKNIWSTRNLIDKKNLASKTLNIHWTCLWLFEIGDVILGYVLFCKQISQEICLEIRLKNCSYILIFESLLITFKLAHSLPTLLSSIYF